MPHLDIVIRIRMTGRQQSAMRTPMCHDTVVFWDLAQCERVSTGAVEGTSCSGHIWMRVGVVTTVRVHEGHIGDELC